MHNDLKIKNDFPIFQTNENKHLIYLDNGATTQKPFVLLDAITHYYIHSNSNIGRGVYKLAEDSGNAYENTRNKVAQFIHAKSKNIIFTSGCTASLNQAAYIIGQTISEKKKIVLSIAEHHANILPWQRLAKEKNLELVFIKDNNILANPSLLPSEFWKDVAVIALTHVSNVTGQIHPVEEWCKIAKKYDIVSVIDGAQGICSQIIDVNKIGCDFYAFSAHKLYGPMGVGILYMTDHYLKHVEPIQLGGGIIEDVLEDSYILLDGVSRFEAGTPNVADVAAFSATLDYLNANNWNKLLEYTHELGDYLYHQISKNNELIILNHEAREVLSHSHIVSFSIKGIHAHDIGTFLANENIAVRVGKHCTHPLHEFLNLNSSVRVSLGIYNTKNDIDFFMEKIQDCIQFFREA